MEGTALYKCDPDALDEISFEKGDRIINVTNVGDGWLMGTVLRTKARGLLPENYILFAETTPAVKPVQAETVKPYLPPRTASQPAVGSPQLSPRTVAPLLPSRSASPIPASAKPPIPPRGGTPQSQSRSVTPEPAEIVGDKESRKFLELFNQRDTDLDGFLQPLEVKDIFSQSGQPKEYLGKVWSMVDITSDGKLSRGEFIMGMWLILQRVRNSNFTLPAKLDNARQNWIEKYDRDIEQNGPPIPSRALKPYAATDDIWGSLERDNQADSISKSKAAEPSAKPSAFAMYTYGRTDEGKNLTDTSLKFAQSDVGKKAANVAYDNREAIEAAAKSEAGQKAMSTAWENRQAVAKGASSGMQFAMKASKK